MADVFTEGFESGDLTTNWTLGGTTVPTIESGIVNNGSYSAKISYSSYSTSTIQKTSALTSMGTSYIRFYLYVSAFPAEADGELLRWTDSSGNTIGMGITFDSNELIFLGDAFEIYSGTNTLTLNTWHVVQVAVRKSTSDALHEMILDGNTTTDTTADSFTSNNWPWRFGHGWGGALSGTYYIDDIVISDSGYPAPIISSAPIFFTIIDN